MLRAELKEMHLPEVDKGGNVSKGQPITMLVDSDVGLLFYFFAFLGLGVPVRPLVSQYQMDC